MKNPTNIRRRGKNCYGQWKDATGRLREECLGPRLDVAREILGELHRIVRRARVGLEDEIGQAQRIPDLLGEYYRAQAIHWRPRYAGEVKAALKAVLAGVESVAQLTAGAVEYARDRLEGSARTKNKNASWVFGFCHWLRGTGRARSPFEALVPVPRADVVARRALSRAEAEGLQREVDGGSSVTSSRSCSGSGLRLGEALALTWADLLPAGLAVRRSKNGDPRNVPIAGELRARLLRTRASRGATVDRRVVLSPRCRPLNVNGGAAGRLMKWLRRAIVRAETPPKGVDLHALRHTHATWAADAGATTAQLMALLGWRSVRMAERYVHRDALNVAAIVSEMSRRSTSAAAPAPRLTAN